MDLLVSKNSSVVLGVFVQKEKIVERSNSFKSVFIMLRQKPLPHALPRFVAQRAAMASSCSRKRPG